MKREKKTELVGFRVTPEEKKYLEKEAGERGLFLSEYLHRLALPSGFIVQSLRKINA